MSQEASRDFEWWENPPVDTVVHEEWHGSEDAPHDVIVEDEAVGVQLELEESARLEWKNRGNENHDDKTWFGYYDDQEIFGRGGLATVTRRVRPLSVVRLCHFVCSLVIIGSILLI